jgi:peptidoglycan-associated lipoprotein
MKKSLIILVVIVFGLAFSLIFFSGCAKKEIVKEESATKEQAVAAKQPGVGEKGTTKEGPAMAASEEETAMAKREKIFVDIHFDFDKFNLKPEAREILKKQAAWLANHATASVLIEGNCDERGTEEYNLALGQRRADAAKGYLVELGIDKKRIKTISYGKDRPLDPGQNEEAWAKNRRDHFVLSFKK